MHEHDPNATTPEAQQVLQHLEAAIEDAERLRQLLASGLAADEHTARPE